MKEHVARHLGMDGAELSSRLSGALTSEVKVSGNALYFLKIRVLTERSGSGEVSVRVTLGCRGGREPLVALHERTIPVPLVCDADAFFGRPGQWYEQMLFVRTNDVGNCLAWEITGDQPFSVQVRVSRTLVERKDIPALEENLANMDKVHATVNGRRYKVFLGINAARGFLAEQALKFGEMTLPGLDATHMPRVAEKSLIGLVGDDNLEGMLNTVSHCIRIDPKNLALVEMDALDLILIQPESAGVVPQSISSNGEAKFMAALSTALLRTSTPVLELKSADLVPGAVVFEPIRHSNLGPSPPGYEYELANFAPIRGKNWSRGAIALPCASDLYQYPEFLGLVRRLVNAGFSLAISESHYDHVPARTWERFNSPLVKVYGRLSMEDQANLFRNCGFVLLPGATLRSARDLSNLASVAIMSGALPILWRGTLPAPLGPLVHTAWGYGSLHGYLCSYNSRLVHERHWLSLYRQFMEQSRQGALRHSLREFGLNRRLIHSRDAMPSAELICVSKRPDNIGTIEANFRRQRYANLGFHLVWNVPQQEVQRCLHASSALNIPNLQVSVVDNNYNIGSCLNHGIRGSQADYWFKIDDDDYYGCHYISDAMNFYLSSGAQAMGKPFGFIYFVAENTSWIRLRAAGNPVEKVERSFPDRPFVCGATLSGKCEDTPLFSTVYRNSCDSKWMESIRSQGIRVFCSDVFNFVAFRSDPSTHSWQVSKKVLQNGSMFLLDGFIGSWCEAD